MLLVNIQCLSQSDAVLTLRIRKKRVRQEGLLDDECDWNAFSDALVARLVARVEMTEPNTMDDRATSEPSQPADVQGRRNTQVENKTAKLAPLTKPIASAVVASAPKA